MLVAWRDIGQRLAVFLLISLNGTERRAVSLQLLIFLLFVSLSLEQILLNAK